MRIKQAIGLGLSVLFGILSFVLPYEALGLPSEVALRTVGVLAITLSLLLTETFATPITCFICIALMYLFGAVPSFGAALSGFTNTTSFFVIVSFALSAAITKVPLGNRLLFSMMRLFGKNIKMILLAFMFTICILSAFISNVATAAIFVAVAVKFLDIYDDEADAKQAGKIFMICIAISATLGGMATPAGSSLNLLIIEFVQEFADTRITFLQWMVCGTPAAFACTLFTWFIATRVFRMPELSASTISAYRDNLRAESIPAKMDAREVYVLGVIVLMFVFWIASSWVPFFDITMVATVGCVLMFLPHIEILTYKEYLKSINWTPYIIISTMIMLGQYLVKNEVTVWLCGLIFPESLAMGAIIAVFIVSLIVFVLMVIIPSAPAIINLLAAPLATLATVSGLSPILFLLPLGMCAGNCIIFPFDTVPAITYAPGYYKMGDLPKVSIPVQLFIAVVMGLWVPAAAALVGLV
ncbi:MAG: sodium:sulfate symporter [Eggerthellaceae bacterium]|jgi:sodium-dependent dicarboxylate transporter 2/3/5|nr:sodium:sulfate symporter [Eggerthellaceae bacterium]